MKINLSHGNGGKETAMLIDGIFMKHFKNEWSAPMADAAILDIPNHLGNKPVFTTDSYVVKPLFFKGGDIGKLAVCGTVNDILTTGGVPLYLSASFIIEEGVELETLSLIAESMKLTAQEANVSIVTGDTKVIEGNGGIYINTSGIGIVGDSPFCFQDLKEDDAIIVTGNLGDHHACILSERMGIANNIVSDAAPLCEIADTLKKEKITVHGIRDITRGGLATVLNEIAIRQGLQAEIEENKIPVLDSVKGLCDILGLDSLYMGNEGKMVLSVPKNEAEKTVALIRQKKYGENAEIIGKFMNGRGVALKTKIGGRRIIQALTGEGLPRIC